MKKIFPILFATIFSAHLFAAEVAADFSAANELYARGKFAEAAAAYENILQGGGVSVPLLFNCGNAEFKAGHPGRAIAAYRRAELLAPRDAELRANLAFVRGQVPGATAHERRWQNWTGQLTLNEGTLLTAIFFWTLCGLLAARQLRPALAPLLRGVTRLSVMLALFSGAVLALQAASHFNAAVAVVTAPEAGARTGPYDDAQTTFTAHDGAELNILDTHDQWVEVSGAGGKTGWLNRRQVDVLPGAGGPVAAVRDRR